LNFRDDAFEPLIVETCWPTKKRRVGDFRRKRSFQAKSVEVLPNAVTDVMVQSDAVDLPPDVTLDVVLQDESVQTKNVETKTVKIETVKTDAVFNEIVLTESAEVWTGADPALGCVMGRPSHSDAKKTKSMAILLGVESKSDGKKKKNKVSAKKK
jgi:hypothetical protein